MFLRQLLVLTISFSVAVGDELLLLQVAWRHGDRSPIAICKGDPTQISAWPQGLGQLTALGMEQHVKLGKIIYNRYVTNLTFLDGHYDSSQIYVRSTDLNRTLLSAVSNFIGFYYDRVGKEEAGVDYPNIADWPQGYVPVPVHTVENKYDYIGNPDAYCPRQTWLWSLIEKTPEWKNLSQEYAGALEALSTACEQPVDIQDMWLYRDEFYCDMVHNHSIPINMSLYDQLYKLDTIIENYQNGLNLDPYDGINFKHEIGKIRGGGILWSIIDHFDLKLNCSKPENQGSSHCSWMKNFKYYAYSVHDTTLAALMSTLDAKRKILIYGGYPRYSAAMLFELWNTTNGPGLKVFYHRNFTETNLEDITSLLDGCSNHMVGDYCNYQQFRTDGIVYYPGDEHKLCQDTTSKSTSFNPNGPNSSPKPGATALKGSVLLIILLYLQTVMS